ncbi:GFA family protein [Paremcibacter congregatus]|uniref:GFA family protein n=1 Tax=Paremcibacter congregatus TaxID=2043170 RepID=UPI003C6E60D8
MMTAPTEIHEGGCTCGHIRYKLTSEPLIVHCCHCHWCQRQTGSAFVVNALYEATHVALLQGQVSEVTMPSPSGNGQKISRCPKCQVAVWSNYYIQGIKEGIRFIRVGSLDHPADLPPDVHIFTKSKLPWVILPPDDLAVDVFYDYETTWTAEHLERRKALLAAASKEPFEHQIS